MAIFADNFIDGPRGIDLSADDAGFVDLPLAANFCVDAGRPYSIFILTRRSNELYAAQLEPVHPAVIANFWRPSGLAMVVFKLDHFVFGRL